MDQTAYKIEDAQAWAQAEQAGLYHGSPLDLRDGFIHLSTSAQTRETAAKWFAGQADLVLATIDLAALGEAVVWEASRGGALFPHVYGPIPMTHVRRVTPLLLDPDGVHIFPDDIA